MSAAGPGGCPCLTSKTDECLDKGVPWQSPESPQSPPWLKSSASVSDTSLSPALDRKKHSYRPTKFLLIQVKGPHRECGVAVRDEGQRRLTRGTLAVGEHNKLLSHHKNIVAPVLSCNPVMDTSSAPQLVKMFSYNNLIQEHIYEAGVINFN